MNRLTCVFVGAVLAMSVACNEDGASNNANSDNNSNNSNNSNNANNANNSNNSNNRVDVVAAADINKAYGEMLCDVVFDCPGRQQDQLIVRYPDKAACYADAAILGGRALGGQQTQASAMSGRVAHDPAAFYRCMDAYRTDRCGITEDALATGCDGIGVGAVRLDGDCVVPPTNRGRLNVDECVDGLFCDAVEGECFGTCAPRSGPCHDSTSGSPCLESEFCPEEGSCLPRRPIGGLCQESGWCVDGSSCSSRGFAGGYCTENHTVALGEDCEHKFECVEGLECESGKCAQTMTDPPDSLPMIGEACDMDVGCVEDSVCGLVSIPESECEGPFCFEFICKPPESEVLGGDCWQDEECVDGLVCASGWFKCAAIGVEAQPCLLGVGCTLGLACLDETPETGIGTCGAPRQSGACSQTHQCAPGFYCTPDEMCAPTLANEMDCRRGSDCESGYCADMTCQDGASSVCMLP